MTAAYSAPVACEVASYGLLVEAGGQKKASTKPTHAKQPDKKINTLF